MAANAGAENSTSRRSEVLRVLRGCDHAMTSAQIAAELGVHKNTVRFHLDALAASGLVEHQRQQVSGPGRPAQMYRAVIGMDPTGPRHYQELAAVLTDALLAHPDGPALALEAGRRWGLKIGEKSSDPVGSINDALAGLIDLLDDFGFAPEIPEGGSTAGSAAESEAARVGVGHSDPPANRAEAGLSAIDRQPGPEGRTPLPMVDAKQCPFLELAEGHRDIICPVHRGLMAGVLEGWGSEIEVSGLEPFPQPDRCHIYLSAPGSGSDAAGSAASAPNRHSTA